MKTNQIMIRELEIFKVKQRTVDGYYFATDFLNQYNEEKGTKKMMSEFLRSASTIEFLNELQNQLNNNVGNSHIILSTDLYNSKKGKNGGVWMNKYLFTKFIMWTSPEYEVKAMIWFHDNLIDFRNQAGDYYKDMCQAINERFLEFFDKKPDPLIFIKEANYLNQLVFGCNSGQRNEANEKQLELMNRLQLANIKMIKEGKAKIERYKILRDLAIYS